MVVFDSSMLLLALDPKARAPLDPKTSAPVERAGERVDYLIERLAGDRAAIVIPTPVLSEVMVRADGAAEGYLAHLNRERVFRIAPFDQKAAIEAALSIRDSLGRGSIRVDSTDPVATRAKIKFDRQIVAIAKAEGAEVIYSDDSDIHAYSVAANIQVYGTGDLPLRPEDPQGSLGF